MRHPLPACRVRAALHLLFPCSRVTQCPAPALLDSLDVIRSGYKPAQLPVVPGAGWNGNAPGREVEELTLAAASPHSPHHHPHTLTDTEQLDTASSCQCHCRGVAEVCGYIAFKGKACAFPPCSLGWAVGPCRQQNQVLVQPCHAGCAVTPSSSEITHLRPETSSQAGARFTF